MMLFGYLTLAVLIIALAILLTRQGNGRMPAFSHREKECGTVLLDDMALDLAERIFDPGDYRWLNDEIGFPALACELSRQRKAMALAWLRCLRASFNELVRAPRSAGIPGGDDGGSTGWAMTFHTLRFQLLLTYAMMVVWMFGPYTRIAPSFGRLRPLLSGGPPKERYGVRA
ncbi:MAG TPA: hypothetical protein VG028_16395 [Terriglobia bacterium]|nr:hypothetical protein [Terriglobia bacterium]